MNTLADGWQIAQKHLAGQHDQKTHGRGGSGSFDDSPETKRLRAKYEDFEPGWGEQWGNHVRNYVSDKLAKSGLDVYRSQAVTGISNEGYGDAFFTTLSRAHATGYARGGNILTFRIPKGSKLYDEDLYGRNTDVGGLRNAGYSGVLRAKMNEVILFNPNDTSF